MAEKPLAFIISPIGDADTPTRREADDLLELIIKPALDIFDFRVLRGDYILEANKIDVDVVQCVQEAELCIADISVDNVNVYYEIGRRDETGKPLILLRAKNAGKMPVDVATRRYIVYDLDSRSGLRDARSQLRDAVQSLVDGGFESSRSSSLSDISSVLQRIERKIDKVIGGSGNIDKRGINFTTSVPDKTVMREPLAAFKLAVRQNNIPLLDAALEQIRVTVDHWKFLDVFASVAAARGSEKAGQIVIDNAEAFMDRTEMSFEKKVEYLSCLVSFLNRTDRECEYLETVLGLCGTLLQDGTNEDADEVSNIHNQLNRLYHGIYASTNDITWLERAREELKKAIALSETHPSYYYNLAMCNLAMYEEKGEDSEYLDEAKGAIDRMFEIGDEKCRSDADHLAMAYRIYRRLHDERAVEFLEKLREVNEVQAALEVMNEE